MSNSNTYQSKLTAYGATERERRKKLLLNTISKSVPSLLSAKKVDIYAPNSAVPSAQVLSLFTTESLNKRELRTLPGETIEAGSIVDWAGSKWLATSVDADEELYQRGILERCNYVLKFRDNSGNVISKNCVIEDATKYTLGERAKETLVVGDSRITLKIAKDSDTQHFKRGLRFIVDDPDSDEALVYEIANSDRITGRYTKSGVYNFIIRETNAIPSDSPNTSVSDNSEYVPGAPSEKGGWF
ncbi:MAG: hypothetical protein RR365_01015 [Bacteroides sp.]